MKAQEEDIEKGRREEGKDDFFSYLDNLMHQLVNNQQVILGRTELLLQDKEINGVLREEISHIMDAAEKNNKLISQMKKKIASGKAGSSLSS